MIDSMTVSYVKNRIKSFSLIEIFSEYGLLHLRLVDRNEFDETKFLDLEKILYKIDGDIPHFKECKDSHLITAYNLNENGDVNIPSPAHLVHDVDEENSTSNGSKYNYV